MYFFFFISGAGTSEGEDSSCEDSKSTENGAAKKPRDSESTEKHGHQAVIGKYFVSVFFLCELITRVLRKLGVVFIRVLR